MADNVQLGYAATVHRSQGVTVDTAHAVLDASVDRSTAYVALTRGRLRNTAWLVVEDDQTTTDVLDTIASRTADNVTVLDAAAREARAAADPVRMRDIYADLATTADRIRWSRHLDDLVRGRHIPPAAGRATASQQFPDVVGRLTGLEAAGVDVDTLLRDLTTGIGRPEDPAAEIATRIDQWSDQHPTVLDPDHHGPLSDLDDQALTGLADRAGRQAQAAAGRAQARHSAQPADVGGSEPAPAWTHRPYGDLTDTELSQRIREAVGESFAHAVDSPAREPDAGADQAVSQMLAERDTRAAMDPGHRRAEDAQRWEVSHLDGRPVDIRDAMRHVDRSARAAAVVAREVSEEQARRRWRRAPTSRQDAGHETGVGEGLTQWAAPTAAIGDRRTPSTWRDALVAQRQRLDEAVTQAGRDALGTAGWAQGLTRPQEVTTRQWQRAVGEVATWRAANHVGGHYPLELTAENGTTPHDAGVHQLARALARHQHKDDPDGQAASPGSRQAAARRRQATSEALRRARRALSEQREQARSQQQRSTTQRPTTRPPRSTPGGPRL
ncbi:C-terminal helicase domain-containing protein [Actinomyces lilanjuaniae]|uniref:C-terminal helicase domain-containing protein n=1 Tax=Actinomyces lilanjuaniae TaxID=2321394 RepID=UPI0013C436B1|nr:helicase C-terminal domain-containing protein [Actinomyces lilanjuaniae]